MSDVHLTLEKRTRDSSDRPDFPVLLMMPTRDFFLTTTIAYVPLQNKRELSLAVTFNAGARVPVAHAECRRVSKGPSISSSCPVEQTHGTLPALGQEPYKHAWSAGKPGR